MRSGKYRWIAVSLAIAAMSAPMGASAQTAADSDILHRIDTRMATLDSLIYSAGVPVVPPNALAADVSVKPDTAFSSAVDALVDAKIKAIKAQTGVQLTGQTYYRPDSAIGLDDEDDGVSRYVGKIQAEARWYFLQSGLLKRNWKIEEVRLMGDLERLQHEKGRSEPGEYAMRERLREVSDSVLGSVIMHRVANLVLLEEAYMHLLGSEKISSDDLMKVLDEHAEAERRLSTLSVAPQYAPSLASVSAAIVTIDSEAVLRNLGNTDIDLKILDLNEQITDRRAENTTWWSDVRLAPFVRYSHYFRHNMRASANVDIGVSFTIPVNTDAARRREILMAEKNLIECRRSDILARSEERVRYIVRETERLNRSIEGEWQRANSLRGYLQMRREAYSHRIGEYNRLAALREYNSYLRSLENIIELQYRRNSLLADLQSLLPAVPVLDLCKFIPLEN